MLWRRYHRVITASHFFAVRTLSRVYMRSAPARFHLLVVVRITRATRARNLDLVYYHVAR